MSRRGSERLKVVYRHGTLSTSSAVQCIGAVFARHDVPVTGLELFGKGIDLTKVPSALKKSGRKGFDLSGHDFNFLLATPRNVPLDFFSIESGGIAKISWDEWIGELFESPDFVMAWVVDVEYDHWQNARDPLEYKVAGKPYDRLPMKSNGLPPPLQKNVIDTSNNPGRWSFQNGWIEAIGAVMWFGEHFWSLTGADRNEVVMSSWLSISEPVPAVTRIQANDRNFTTAEGASGQLQDRLRSLLFPVHD